MDGAISVEFVQTIADIGEDAWHRLAHGDGFYLSYPWLAWAEIDPAVTSTYVIARDDSGVAVGAVPTYLWHGGAVPSMNLAYSPSHLAGENAGRPVSDTEHASFLPVLLVGSRAGYHGGAALCDALTAARRAHVLDALFSGVGVLAEQTSVACTAMLYVPVAHARECQSAWNRVVAEPARRPLVAPLSAEAVIVTADTGSQPEIAGAAERREWRRERRRYDAAADRVEAVPLSRCVDLVAPLLGATQRKYGAQDTDEDMRRYLAQQVDALDAYSHVLLEYRGSTAVGFALSYVWDDGVYVRVAGFGERAAPYSYFNLTVYRPRDIAAAKGLQMINLGTGTYAAKRSRGAQPRFTAGLVQPPVGASPDLVRAFTTSGPDYQDAVRVWPQAQPGGHVPRQSPRHAAEG